MDELFKIEESKSPRLKWLEASGITTHYAPHMGEEGYTWCAWGKANDTDGNGIPDDLEACGYGNSEDESIANLCQKIKKPLWNEVSLSNEKMDNGE
jgi:hypothetical protein